ncbi:MAG: hypothetical protein NTY07_12890 [Bacteroidia bacterium]|nr:hypothetical protein [Bacteroidia bacterium]
MENFKSKYASLKHSIRANRERKMVTESIEQINADSCGLTSLVSSWCKPKIDIGDQVMYAEEITKMEVQWNE